MPAIGCSILLGSTTCSRPGWSPEVDAVSEQLGALSRSRAGQLRGDAARTRITELLAKPSPMVICGHRENMPVLLAQARAVLPGFPPGDEWAPPKAGFWVLHVARGRLAALEHHTTSD